LLLVFSFIFISGCAPGEVVETAPEDSPSSETERINELYRQFSDFEKGDIDFWVEKGGGIGSDHYQRLEERLNSFESQEIAPEDIERVREKLLPLDPRFETVPEEIIEEDIQEEQPKEDKLALRFKPFWGDCEEKDDVRFTFSPIDPVVIKVIKPMGKMHISHPLPTKHMYIIDDKGVGDSNYVTYDVVAPADGYIVNIEALPNRVNDYGFSIWHSCSVLSSYTHLGDLSPEIRATTGEIPPGSQWEALNKNAIFVKAGQHIASSKGGFDFGVLDSKVSLTGWVFPTHQGGGVQIHTADPFDYFIEPVRSQMLEKNARKVEPFGGKVDYDIDGRLVGNWFEEGKVVYESGPPEFTTKDHLAIAYNYIDPTLIEVSFGAEDDIGITYEDCGVCDYSFGVKGNKPDPADVSVETGLIKYELLGEEHIDHPTLGFRVGVSTDEVLGVFLVQMLDDRTIKGEVFAKKTASQVTGFTSNAKIYER